MKTKAIIPPGPPELDNGKMLPIAMAMLQQGQGDGMGTLEEKIRRIELDMLWSDDPGFDTPHPGILRGDREENDAVYLLSEALGKALQRKKRIDHVGDTIPICAYHEDIVKLLPVIRKAVNLINQRSSQVDIRLGKIEGHNLQLYFVGK